MYYVLKTYGIYLVYLLYIINTVCAYCTFCFLWLLYPQKAFATTYMCISVKGWSMQYYTTPEHRPLCCQAAGCYYAALELTGRFLSAHGQGLGQASQPTLHTHKTLGMWAARISLLIQLRRFKEAEAEMAAFRDLESPDLFYEFHSHSYPGKTGMRMQVYVCIVLTYHIRSDDELKCTHTHTHVVCI